MTPGRWGQLDELYHAVRSLTPSERNAQLERADPELRATVLSILAHEGSPENGDAPQQEAFLDRPAWEGRSSLLQHSGSSDAERLVNAGEQLGPYRIEQKIGQGGMGTVYRATDTRLDRPVALKISRKLFDDRLEREARAISSINHPHICTLHDIGPDYIVMEFVEGETLAARIGKGALPVSDVLRYGAQIAGALAAAHDKEITHRDLKPANVMITKNGVKVLDFGLAKRSTPDGAPSVTGAVMGTPAYMAPEQLKGHAADARTDIFALGLTLYEMATGKCLAPGRTPAMDGLPPRFAHVVERCLEPEAENRWQSACDVKAELEWVPGEEPVTGARSGAAAWVPRAKSRWLRLAVAAPSLAVAAVLVWALFWNRAAPPRTVLNVSLLPPPETSFRFARNGEGGFALSPDGTSLAFVGRTQGKAHLWLRTLAESESRLLPDSEGAYNPFWSPDSRWIGFFTPLKLKKIGVASGSVVDVLDRPGPNQMGSWNARGVIIYGNPNPVRGGNAQNFLSKIQDGGGTSVRIPETDRGSFPDFLPDGRRFAEAGQVSCVVPYEVSGKSVTQVQVSYQGQLSNSVAEPVDGVVPGVFTANSSGSGQGAIINQDGTANSASNPAALGSIVSIYGTGEGQTNPAGVDGSLDVAAPLPPQPVTQPLTAIVGGVAATVEYAGGVSGLIAGMLQVNVQIPEGIPTGSAVPIVLSIGGTTSQTNVTVAIH